ncbi:MAG: FAD-linked oxidase, partial [Chitinophagaceae bacterium]|nr:FAD-linked oxidase [Chitinophagaceae bacterium]
IHWGKNAAWSFPGLVEIMYGGNVTEWKEQRSSLLSENLAKLFTNDFLRHTHLSAH